MLLCQLGMTYAADALKDRDCSAAGRRDVDSVLAATVQLLCGS